jgi:putative acyl-CoA dehydrogenase
VLNTHDIYGNRVDTVTYSPSYHSLMSIGIQSGVTSMPWDGLAPQSSDNSHVARACLIYMFNQVDPGPCCPLVMTFAGFPAIESSTVLGDKYKSLLLSKLKTRVYDDRNLCIEQKNGITLGMSMTEKQGGSDVRANTTTAVKVTGDEATGDNFDNLYKITGHKWFTSAPMSDVFLTLAKVDDQVTCFLVPRFHNGGYNAGLRFQRLKEKLGDKSNASSEVEYDGCYAYRISDVGSGVKSIIQMVHHTRLECVLGSAGAMHKALRYSLNHVLGREAFGKRLIEQPLMRRLLGDMVVAAKAATAVGVRLARSFDGESKHEKIYGRIGVAASKYYICKEQPYFVYECLEMLGGIGYCETFPLAAMYRAAPLNSVWEGSGNVMALDVVRGLMHEGEEILEVFEKEWEGVRGRKVGKFGELFDDFFEKRVMEVIKSLRGRDRDQVEMVARELSTNIALGLQGIEMIHAAEDGIISDFELELWMSKLHKSRGVGRHFGECELVGEGRSSEELMRLYGEAIESF